MALQSLGGKQGFIMSADGGMASSGTANTTLDAAGESRAYIGKVYLAGGTGSKTISSAGGKIWWRTAGTTFANAGTTIRVGIQDVNASGLEDGTFDVYDDLVGGTDTITGSADQVTTMSSGTKTINHGDLIAVVIEMTAKGGTDSVIVAGTNASPLARSTNVNFPYTSVDTGTLAKAATGVVGSSIIFDDGTLGWIGFQAFAPGILTATATNVSSTSNPDEMAAIFQVPFKCKISGGYLYLGSIGSADTFEIVAYSDPLGTPTIIETLTPDQDLSGTSAASPYCFWFTTPITISPNTNYAISLRPTAANNISFSYVSLGSGNDEFKKAFPFGTGIKHGGRIDQTGAFTEVQTYNIPLFGMFVEQLDDGVSTGGEVSFVS